MSNIKLTYVNETTLVTLGALPGNDSKAVAHALTAFAERQVNLDMISQTAPMGGVIRLSFTISDESLSDALAGLACVRKEYPSATSEILPGNCKISFYDERMTHTPQVAAKVITLLANADVHVMLITTSDVDISVLVPASSLDNALEALGTELGVTAQEASF